MLTGGWGGGGGNTHSVQRSKEEDVLERSTKTTALFVRLRMDNLPTRNGNGNKSHAACGDTSLRETPLKRAMAMVGLRDSTYGAKDL